MKLFLACAIALTSAASPRSATAQTATDSSARLIALGHRLFDGRGLCFSCHGKSGEGALGPTTRLADRKLVHAKPTIDDIARVVRSGIDSAQSVSGKVMPPRGGSRLTDQQILAVAAYVLSLQPKAADPPR